MRSRLRERGSQNAHANPDQRRLDHKPAVEKRPVQTAHAAELDDERRQPEAERQPDETREDAERPRLAMHVAGNIACRNAQASQSMQGRRPAQGHASSALIGDERGHQQAKDRQYAEIEHD